MTEKETESRKDEQVQLEDLEPEEAKVEEVKGGPQFGTAGQGG